MAINLLEGSYPPSVVQFMHNNSVIFFESDYATAPPEKCEITVSNGTVTETVTIYPSPDNKFYYNFKDLILSLNSIKIKKYIDDLDLTGQRYKDWSRILEIVSIELKIIFTDNTLALPSFEIYSFETYFLNAVKQLNRRAYKAFDNFPINGKGVALLPRSEKPNSYPKIKYWTGYPFDVSFYNTKPFNAIVQDPITFVSSAGLVIFENDIVSKITRIILSDGMNSDVQDYLAPLQKNVYEVDINYDSVLQTKIHLESEETNLCKGVYLKWVNALGGLSYWLFKLNDEELAVKSLGDLENDFLNLQNTISPTENLGQNATGSVDLYEAFDESYTHILQDLLISNKVYMFTGEQYSAATPLDWVETKIKSAKVLKQEKDFNTSRVKLTFELPDYYTKKL